LQHSEILPDKAPDKVKVQVLITIISSVLTKYLKISQKLSRAIIYSRFGKQKRDYQNALDSPGPGAYDIKLR
jgi:hypothetical protein